MIRRFSVILFFVCVAPLLRGADLLDCIVATVNGHIILQSDWDDALRYQALIAGLAPGQASTAERKAVLDRLIDQELLQEQMHATDFQHATESEIDPRMQEIRQQHGDATDDSSWLKVLSKYGFDAETFRHHVALELDLLRLVDARLRPKVSIDSNSIESYYSQELLPQLRQSGANEVPLAAATPKIKELLTEQKVNELLEAWLIDLRSGSQIRTELSTDYSSGEAR
jgi:hypothetical protein